MTIFDSRLIATFSLLIMSTLPAMAARNLDKNLGWPGQTLSGSNCQGREQAFGPFDYTDTTFTVAGNYTRHGRSEAPLRTVEKVHFTAKVERLISGQTGVNPMVDIDYTIRAFPNHHRALYAAIRGYLRQPPLALRDGQADVFRPGYQGFPPPECYLQRAQYFAPEDGMVAALFGLYLHRRNDLDGALAKYVEAEKLFGETEYAELYYNRGLLHFDRGDYSEAQEYADKAYALNYQLPGLRRKLEQRGH
jgi:tetratricopeptide (TPR) repeat protein